MSQATIETCDVFDGMEEAVLHIIADYLRGTRQVYAAHIDDDEVTSPQPKKHHRPSSVVLGQLTKLVKQITWPHELIYTQASLPAVYEDLSPMSFVNGYLELLVMVKDDTRVDAVSPTGINGQQRGLQMACGIGVSCRLAAASRAGLGSVDRSGHQTETEVGPSVA